MPTGGWRATLGERARNRTVDREKESAEYVKTKTQGNERVRERRRERCNESAGREGKRKRDKGRERERGRAIDR